MNVCEWCVYVNVFIPESHKVFNKTFILDTDVAPVHTPNNVFVSLNKDFHIFFKPDLMMYGP